MPVAWVVLRSTNQKAICKYLLSSPERTQTLGANRRIQNFAPLKVGVGEMRALNFWRSC
jgi:hypothetical protein